MPVAATLFTDVALEHVVSSLLRLPDPDFVLAAQGMGRQELRKLEADDEISAALETRREAVISTPWRLEPYDSEPAEWLWMTLMPHMDELLRGAWSALPYGYAVQEIVYEKGPRIGLSRITEKPLEWFEPRRDGTLWYSAPAGSAGMSYVPGIPTQVDIETKFLLTRRNANYRNPFGEALLSRCYWPWFFRTNGWRFWMRFVERFGDPLLLGQVFDPSAFVNAMQGLGLDAVVGVSKDENISAVTNAQAGEFEKLESALGRRIQKLILGQTLTSEVGNTGSYAAAQVHNNVRDDKRRADIRMVSGAVQMVCDALWRLNGLPGKAPTFVMADDAGLQAARGDRDAKVVPAMIATGVRPTMQYWIEAYDWEPEQLEEIPAPSVSPTPVQPLASSAPVQLAARKPQRFTQDQAAVEQLADAALARASSPIPAEAVRSAILAAADPDDLQNRLENLYRGHDASEFSELMERSIFAADVLGYVTAEKRVGI